MNCNLCGEPREARRHQPDYDSDTGPHEFDDGVYPPPRRTTSDETTQRKDRP